MWQLNSVQGAQPHARRRVCWTSQSPLFGFLEHSVMSLQIIYDLYFGNFVWNGKASKRRTKQAGDITETSKQSSGTRRYHGNLETVIWNQNHLSWKNRQKEAHRSIGSAHRHRKGCDLPFNSHVVFTEEGDAIFAFTGTILSFRMFGTLCFKPHQLLRTPSLPSVVYLTLLPEEDTSLHLVRLGFCGADSDTGVVHLDLPPLFSSVFTSISPPLLRILLNLFVKKASCLFFFFFPKMMAEKHVLKHSRGASILSVGLSLFSWLSSV